MALDLSGRIPYYDSMNTASTTTLLPPQAVAEQLGIAPKTLYAWLEAGVVSHAFDVQGRPVFTEQEVQRVAVVVQERRALRASMRLTKVPV